MTSVIELLVRIRLLGRALAVARLSLLLVVAASLGCSPGRHEVTGGGTASPQGVGILVGRGTEVSSGFGFVAALFVGSDKIPKCGGAVLSGGWVLTAGHCGPIDRIVVMRRDLGDAGQGSQFKVKREQCFRHRGYVKDSRENDLELIKVDPPPTDTIALASNANWETDSDTVVNILGWGEDCGANVHLCIGAVQIVPRDDCARAYLKMKSNIKISERDFCTSSIPVGVGEGDSGGPILATTKAGTQLVGIISTGNGSSQLPDSHMRLTEYLDWIADVRGGKPVTQECLN